MSDLALILIITKPVVFVCSFKINVQECIYYFEKYCDHFPKAKFSIK